MKAKNWVNAFQCQKPPAWWFTMSATLNEPASMMIPTHESPRDSS